MTPATAEQFAFVAWWDKHVRGDGKPKQTGAGLRQLARDDAEAQTGISQQQVTA